MNTLLFVYNADADLANGLWDMACKTLSPRTYPCFLCGITYGATSIRPEWQQFPQSLPLEARFPHRDEFQREFPQLKEQRLPVVFWQHEASELTPLLTAIELDSLSLPELMQRLQQATQLA